MKITLISGALLLLSGPLYASGIPCASCGVIYSAEKQQNETDNISESFPKDAVLVTPLRANMPTSTDVALYAPDSGCIYTGRLSSTVSEDKKIRVIDVDRKRCGHKVDHVDLIVPDFVAGYHYDEGTAVKLYRASIMTPAGPLISPEMAKYILEQAKESALQATQQNTLILPKKDH